MRSHCKLSKIPYLIQPFCEISQTSVGENEEVNLEEQLLLRGRGPLRMPDEESGLLLVTIGRGEEMAQIT